MSFINVVGNVQGTIGSINNTVQEVLGIFGADVVAVLDSDTYEQLFQAARPMRANINRTQRLMDHPLEDGSTISDFSIIDPVEIELVLMLTGDEYVEVYSEIRTHWESRIPVVVQTRADTFEDMLIQNIPHEETPDTIDVIPMSIKLRQIQIIEVQYQALPEKAVEKPTDQSTVDRGAQQPKSSSVLYDVSQWVSKKINGQ